MGNVLYAGKMTENNHTIILFISRTTSLSNCFKDIFKYNEERAFGSISIFVSINKIHEELINNT